MYLMYLH